MQIVTFGTMAARGVIRDVGRVLDFPYAQVDTIAKMIPNELNITIDKALKMNPELRNQYEGDEQIHYLIDMSKRWLLYTSAKDFSFQVYNNKADYKKNSLILSALLALLGGVATYFISGHALRPIREFSEKIEEVQAQNLADSRIEENKVKEPVSYTHLSGIAPSRTPCGQIYLQKKGSPIPIEFVASIGRRITKTTRMMYVRYRSGFSLAVENFFPGIL